MEVLLAAIGVGVLALGLGLLLAFLRGTLVYFIWPYIAVAVFNLPALTWWQAVLLAWLCGLLFRSGESTKKSD